MSSTSSRRAIVIGSSIAGLTAARVLADHFDEVILLERDRLPEGADFRKGVPQAHHPHALLLRGKQIIEQLFPGLFDELRAAGAVDINFGLEAAWFAFGHWRQRYNSQLIAPAMSRPLLESAIYRRLAKNPKVRFIQESDVIGLMTSPGQERIVGLKVRSRSDPNAPETNLSADLVVDASGRDSRAPEWLQGLGYAAPKETIVNSRPGYATRVFAQPAHFAEDWKMLYVQPTPPGGKRGGIILPLEGKRWHICLIGMAGDYPPTDEAGYLEFARSLPTPKLIEIIQAAEPLTPVLGYRRAENQLRHYAALPRYLEGFLVIGDAACAFNPVYGQGMSVAAIEALTLDGCLRQQRSSDLTGLASRFQKQLAQVTAGPWQMATGEDLRWPIGGEEQRVDFPTRMMQAYITRVMQAMTVNPKVVDAFYQVQNMVAPPTLLFRPDIMVEIFRTRMPEVPAQITAEPAAASA